VGGGTTQVQQQKKGKVFPMVVRASEMNKEVPTPVGTATLGNYSEMSLFSPVVRPERLS